jgi:hypothetical protein
MRDGLPTVPITSKHATTSFLSAPVRPPGWTGERFLGEAWLPADLTQHTPLHSEPLWDAWGLALAGRLEPAREQQFEHFYFCHSGRSRRAGGW